MAVFTLVPLAEAGQSARRKPVKPVLGQDLPHSRLRVSQSNCPNGLRPSKRKPLLLILASGQLRKPPRRGAPREPYIIVTKWDMGTKLRIERRRA